MDISVAIGVQDMEIRHLHHVIGGCDKSIVWAKVVNIKAKG